MFRTLIEEDTILPTDEAWCSDRGRWIIVGEKIVTGLKWGEGWHVKMRRKINTI